MDDARRIERYPAVFSVAAVVAALVSLLLAWWDDGNGLQVETHWPKAFFVGAAVAVVIAIADLTGQLQRNVKDRLATISLLLMLTGLFGFFIRADDSEHFAELPFTHHVKPGFLMAGLAFLLLVPRVVFPLTDAPTRTAISDGTRVLAALSYVVIVTIGAMLLLLSWDPLQDRNLPRGPRKVAGESAAKTSGSQWNLYADIRKIQDECLREVPAPAGVGLIATSYNGTVTIGSPYDVIGRVRESGPVSWSPSGRYFSVNTGAVYDVSPTGILRDTRLEKWGWSPIADCLVGITKKGALEVRIPNGDARVLVSDRRANNPNFESVPDPVVVRNFRFSANGRFLELRIERAPPVVLDLRKNRVAGRAAISSQDFDGPEMCPDFSKIASESCSTDGRYVAGIQRDRLVLVSEGGTRPLAFGPYEDRFPEWGPPHTGVLFLRHPDDSDHGEVWFIPEGGRAIRTPLGLPSAELFGYETYPWPEVIDWSVSPSWIVWRAR